MSWKDFGEDFACAYRELSLGRLVIWLLRRFLKWANAPITVANLDYRFAFAFSTALFLLFALATYGSWKFFLVAVAAIICAYKTIWK